MGTILLALIISFIFISPLVFSSKSSNLKRRSSDFIGDEEQKEPLAVVNNNDKVDTSNISCFKRIRESSSAKFDQIKMKEEFLDEEKESDFGFDNYDAKLHLYKEEELIKSISDYRRYSVRYYCQRSCPFKVVTDRARVFQSIYGMVKGNEECWYSGFMRPFIIFEGETGVDHGGLTSECIELLIEGFIKADDQRILNDNFYNQINHSSRPRPRRDDDYYDFTEAFFIEMSSGIYVPNTRYPHKIFKFIGSCFALAFNLDIPLGIEFLPAFYRTLTDEQTSGFVSTEDELKYIDIELFNGLKALREMDLEPLQLEFMGNEVTSANLEKFIRHETNLHCYLNYKQHLDSLKEGFLSLIDICLFDDLNIKYEDLHEIMTGNFVLTAQDFLKHVNVTRLTDPNSRKWIFEIIEEFSAQERLLLFKFITARRSVPFKGLKKFMNPLSFVSIYLPNPSHLPTASTCASLMKIPVYPNKEILREKLLMAINSCETFDLE